MYMEMSKKRQVFRAGRIQAITGDECLHSRDCFFRKFFLTSGNNGDIIVISK